MDCNQLNQNADSHNRGWKNSERGGNVKVSDREIIDRLFKKKKNGGEAVARLGYVKSTF